jgi:hypothetical protein
MDRAFEEALDLIFETEVALLLGWEGREFCRLKNDGDIFVAIDDV